MRKLQNLKQDMMPWFNQAPHPRKNFLKLKKKQQKMLELKLLLLVMLLMLILINYISFHLLGVELVSVLIPAYTRFKKATV